MSSRALAVLRFRRVEEPGRRRQVSPHAVPAQGFAGALAWLKRNDWTVVDAATLVAGLDDPATLPERAATITIDGPYRSLISDALPLLRAHGLPAIVFVPVHFVGRDAALEPTDVRPTPVCTWNDLRYLESHGVSIQSQGVTGRSFHGLSEPERAWEMVRSREALEAGLRRPVELFAFPRGDPGSHPADGAALARRAGYRAAFVCGGGVNRLPDAEPHRLARVTVGGKTDLARALGPFSRGPADAREPPARARPTPSRSPDRPP